MHCLVSQDYFYVKFILICPKTEAVIGSYFLFKKVVLKISQNSQKNTCPGLFFYKVAGWVVRKFYRAPPVAAFEKSI